MQHETNKLRILLIDIETAPNLGYSWGPKYETNIVEYTQEWYMLSFAAKWLDDKKTEVYGLCDFPLYAKDKQSDLELCRKLWNMINEADIIIAHNGVDFDFKRINTRFLVNGLTPPSPSKTIDTKKLAKKHFSFTSNSLNELCQNLGVGKKVDTGGFKLWTDCLQGVKSAWEKMKKYNKMDVVLLEKLYKAIRPWVTNHHNVGINVSKEACHNCGSANTQRRGFAYTKQTRYRRYQCIDCSAWFTGPYVKESLVIKV